MCRVDPAVPARRGVSVRVDPLGAVGAARYFTDLIGITMNAELNTRTIAQTKMIT